jgi:XapX domain-containing protein
VTSYVVSLVIGLAVGLVYGLLGVRSPAPPIMALVGLLGMTLGEQAIVMVKDHLTPPSHTSMRQIPGERREPSSRQR